MMQASHNSEAELVYNFGLISNYGQLCDCEHYLHLINHKCM